MCFLCEFIKLELQIAVENDIVFVFTWKKEQFKDSIAAEICKIWNIISTVLS